MDIEKYCYKIKMTPLFEKMSDRVLKDALARADKKTYQPGQNIDTLECLAFMAKGSANVYSADSRRRLLLRRIRSGEVFGAAGLFLSGNCFSHIYSKGISRVLLFDISTVEYMLQNDSEFMYGYLRFLSGRICYLNQKITCLTAGSTERKLAMFIDSFGQDQLKFPVNLTAISDMLDIGRASLYRALDKMAQDGCIARDGNSITVLDRKKMLEKY